MDILNIKEDLSFLLYGTTEEEKLEFLNCLGPKTLETKASFSEKEFADAFLSKLGANHRVLRQAHRFFRDVKDVHVVGGDLFYEYDGTLQNAGMKSAGVYLDYNEAKGHHYLDLFDSVQEWYQYHSDSFDEFSFKMDDQFEVNFSQDFEAQDIAEAKARFLSFELRWLSPHERLEIIKSSFDKNVVEIKTKKFESYLGTKKSEEHREMARQGLESLSPDYQNWIRPGTETQEILDWISLVILIESKGNENKENGDHMGLMQVHKERFKKYAPDSFDGKNFKDPQVNILTGTKYLLKYCFGLSRNYDQTFSRAVANYNMGASAVGGYRQGERKLTDETRNYVRDVIIYSRLLGWEIK